MRASLLLFLATYLLGTGVTAHAETLNYNLTLANLNFCHPELAPCGSPFIFDFQISSNATPESYTANSFTFGADQITAGPGNTSYGGEDFTIFTDQKFFLGTLFPNADPNRYVVGYGQFFYEANGLQLFTGFPAHPTLLTGSSGPLFDGTTYDTVTTRGLENPGTISYGGSTIITDLTATPEPSTLLLLGTGLAAASTRLRKHAAKAPRRHRAVVP